MHGSTTLDWTTTHPPGNPGIPREVIGLAVEGAAEGFLFRFDSSVLNGAVDAIQGQCKLGDALTGFAVAVALLDCPLGTHLAGELADGEGHIPAVKLGGLLFLVSAHGPVLPSVWPT